MNLKRIINLIVERRNQKMKTKQLEKLCLTKIRVMRMSIVPDEYEICRFNCDSVYQINCPNYKPAGELPTRKGKVAYELSKKPGWRP